MTIATLIMRHEGPFKATFNADLRHYCSSITGFDIIRFDDEVVQSGDRPMAQVLSERYGEGASALVSRILDDELRTP